MTRSPATPTLAQGENARPGRAARSGLVGYGYWWWTVPALVLTGTVIYLATASGAFYAFTNWTGIGPYNFVGVSNFVKVFQTPQLLGALVNTVLLAVGFVVFTNLIGLGFALALNRTLKTRYLLRTLIFLPVVLSPVAVSFIWKFIFAYNGPLNQILGDVGLGSLRHNWLAVPKLALGCVLVVMVWQPSGSSGGLPGGLATVPAELEEAAAIDEPGCGAGSAASRCR
jgi:raffinose/stachyose/melibiose transport system permease protein